MRGPKAMAIAVLAFFASSLLAVHLMVPDAPAQAALASSALPVLAAPAPEPLPRPTWSAPPAARVQPAAVPPGSAHDALPDGPELPDGLNLGVAPVPPAAASPEWERKLHACVERKIQGKTEVRPALPGRWPAVKKAREELRARRLQARAACERELPR